MKRKRFEDPDIRRRQILDAARKTIGRMPFRQLSMDDIAKTAGISKGLLYLYFKDKDALFAEVMRDLAASFRQLLSELPPIVDARQGLEDLIRAILKFGEDRREVTTQFIGEQLMSSPHAALLSREWNDLVRSIGLHLKKCEDAGLLRSHDRDLSAEVLIEVAKLYLKRKYVHKKIQRPLPEYAPQIADFFVHGFGRPPRRKSR